MKHTICLLYRYPFRALLVRLVPPLLVPILYLARAGIGKIEGPMTFIPLRSLYTIRLRTDAFSFGIIAIHLCSSVYSNLAAAPKKKSPFLVSADL